MSRPSLNDLAAFMAVASHRNFRRAADELGVAPSTLSHTLRGLEERLGVRLLNRTTRSVSTTEAGRQLLDRLQPALSLLDDALDQAMAFHGRVSGLVRINTPRIPAAMLTREILPVMAERFPNVTVDIVASGFDAGVRLRDSIPKDMVAVPLRRAVRFLCVASPGYLAQAGAPTTPEDLKRHRCIGHRLPGGRLYRWEFERAGQALVVETASAVVLDDEELMVDAAIRGLGVAYVVAPAAEAALADGRLREVLSPWTQAAEDVAIYYPGHRAVPPALRAFLDVVRALG